MDTSDLGVSEEAWFSDEAAATLLGYAEEEVMGHKVGQVLTKKKYINCTCDQMRRTKGLFSSSLSTISVWLFQQSGHLSFVLMHMYIYILVFYKQ